MERSLEIRQFRNLGIVSEKEKAERLVLNTSVEKGKMGNLIILIGPNNSGKSNVLDALKAYGNGKTDESDITFLETSDEFAHPDIRLVTKDCDGEDIYFNGVNLDGSYNSNLNLVKSGYGEKNKIPPISIAERDELIKNCNQAVELLANKRRRYGYSFPSECIVQIQKLVEKLAAAEKADDFKTLIKEYISKPPYSKYMENRPDPYNRKDAFDIISKSIAISKASSDEEDAETQYERRYGIHFRPQVYVYESQDITDKDLQCSPDNITSNKFFSTLFSASEQEHIKAEYALYKKFQQRSLLDQLEEEYEEKFQKISNDFNKMYFADKNHYRFRARFDTNGLSCSISRNKKPVIISKQSTGFKWYFNFYFQLNSGANLGPGDIVIMDEPATNLHPYGQTELRNHIKEYAMKTDLTFVLATHSPFLLDIDNFDELRVVFTKDSIAHIANSFHVVDHNDPDTLLPIKQSLTISQNVLYDYDVQVVFVEGISDYNILTMFKKLLNVENKIAFLPINGVGAKGAQNEIIKKLIKIGKPDSILLCDNDKAGQAMKDAAKDADIEVITLGDINQEYKSLESLFSKSDNEKFGFTKAHNDDKHGHYSTLTSQFKNIAKLNDFDKETKANFKKLFERLCE